MICTSKIACKCGCCSELVRFSLPIRQFSPRPQTSWLGLYLLHIIRVLDVVAGAVFTWNGSMALFAWLLTVTALPLLLVRSQGRNVVFKLYVSSRIIASYELKDTGPVKVA